MLSFLTGPVVLGILRHILTAAGGALAANGMLEAAQVETAVGAALTIAGIAWSAWEKRSRTQ